MELISTHLVKKSDLGFHGNLFGGQILSWIDSSAAAFAAQCCDTPRVVTISIEKCVFKKAVKESQIIKIYGEIEEVGNTSITIKIEARAHNVYTGKQINALETYIKFVRIDDEGNPIPISDKVKQKYKKNQ